MATQVDERLLAVSDPSSDHECARHRGSIMKKKGRTGSSFDNFLQEEGIYEQFTARAINPDRSPAANSAPATSLYRLAAPHRPLVLA